MHRLYSLYKLLMRIHRCKMLYYGSGTSSLTDYEYDRLESSFIAIHGKKRYDIYVGVGYREGYYEKFRSKYMKIIGRG